MQHSQTRNLLCPLEINSQLNRINIRMNIYEYIYLYIYIYIAAMEISQSLI